MLPVTFVCMICRSLRELCNALDLVGSREKSMSDASDADLVQYLDQRLAELRMAVERGREQNLASMGARGLLNSGAAIKNGVAALDQNVSAYVAEIGELVSRWSGPNLARTRCREIIAAHMRTVLTDLVQRQYAYRDGTRAWRSEAVDTAFDGLLVQVRDKLTARIREFELGADRDKNEIASALDGLLTQLQEPSKGLAALIEPDAATIRAQLEKQKPNTTIMQEAGRSMRSTIEGAIGGAMGNALSPGMARALDTFLKAVGLG